MATDPPRASEADEDYEDDAPLGWCADFDAHHSAGAHDFCNGHQSAFCRLCDRGCRECSDDPICSDCGVHLNSEFHDWDCWLADLGEGEE